MRGTRPPNVPASVPRIVINGGRIGNDPPPVIPAPVAGLGRLRKIALIGSAPTVDLAPWYDPSWEIWAHATVHPFCKRVDRFFDLHPWEWISTKPVPGYLAWLKTCKTPVYMQRKMQDVPSSVRFPRERLVAEFPKYFTSHAAWMIALALTEGVTHLGFYGIHYALDEEHKKQRAGCEFWMGIAVGKGVQIVNPPGSPLLREPGWLYGYESHSGKTHIREKTGGKKPQPYADLPPDLRITELSDPQALRSAGRVDVAHGVMAEESFRAQVEGRAPILPNGQKAWEDTWHAPVRPAQRPLTTSLSGTQSARENAPLPGRSRPRSPHGGTRKTSRSRRTTARTKTSSSPARTSLQRKG